MFGALARWATATIAWIRDVRAALDQAQEDELGSLSNEEIDQL